MKYIAKTMLIAAAALLSACTGKEDPTWGQQNGTLAMRFDVTVNLAEQIVGQNVTSKAQNTDNYVVKVMKAGTTEVAKDVNGRPVEYTCATVPEIVTLPVGLYNVVSYSHELAPAEWDKPHYYGISDQFEIRESALTNVNDIVCKLNNVKVTILYGPTFLDEMEDWTVTVSNGAGYRSFGPGESRAAYFAVAPLTVTMNGTRKDGEQVVMPPKVYSEVNAGEHRQITVDVLLVDETTGTTGADIAFDLTTRLTDLDHNVTIIEPEIPDPVDPIDPGDGDAPTIVGRGFDIAQPVTYAAAGGTSVLVDFAAAERIQDLWVTIDSPFLTAEFLGEIGIPLSFNLADLDATLKQAFVDLGLIGTDPIRGSVGMVFDISVFTTLLPAGTHNFELELVDQAGGRAEAMLVLKPF